MTELAAQARYWRAIVMRAWRDTFATLQFKFGPLTRKAAVFLVILAVLFQTGALTVAENRSYSALLTLGAIVIVFVLEMIVRAITLPAQLAAEQEGKLESFINRELAQTDLQRAVAEFEDLIGEGTRLLDQAELFLRADFISGTRAKIENWDARATDLVKTYAPVEKFGYSTIASLPHARGFVSVNNLTTAGLALREFMTTKITKLRSIGMRVAARGGSK